ncbi:MAG TPA: DUF2007 domain-containing protein [Anaeromyxobacteraceae bacterium]|nr:DUF2007 domain-containing protein [Anaeromyxobacteraceae bacterium]
MRNAREPSPQDEQHTAEYRTVAVYWTVPEAELARSLLASDGIPVAAVDTVDAALLPGTTPVRLLVPADDLDRSRLLLEGRGPAGTQADATASPEAEAAPGGAWSRLALALIVAALVLAGMLSW